VERGKGEGGGGGGGGGRQEAKVRPPYVRTPGLPSDGDMASGEEGLLGESQVAPVRTEESGGETGGGETGGGGRNRKRDRG